MHRSQHSTNETDHLALSLSNPQRRLAIGTGQIIATSDKIYGPTEGLPRREEHALQRPCPRNRARRPWS